MTNRTVTEKIAALFAESRVYSYGRGDSIVFAHQDPEGVMLLIEGTIEQYDLTPEGNKVVVNIFKPGAFFPMSWAINKTPNVYFFAALTDVKVKRANPDVVARFLQDNPDVLFDLLSRVYKGTDGLLRRLVLAASGVASSRLILELLIEGHRFGEDTSSGRRLIKVKQSSLAARSGLARETISRELHKLAGEGLLTLEKQGVALDMQALEARLDVDV